MRWNTLVYDNDHNSNRKNCGAWINKRRRSSQMNKFFVCGRVMFKKRRVGEIMLGLFIKTRWLETQRQNEERKKSKFCHPQRELRKGKKKETDEKEKQNKSKNASKNKGDSNKNNNVIRFIFFLSLSFSRSLSFVFFLFKNSTECFELPFLYAILCLSLRSAALFHTHGRVSSILALSSFTISVCLLCVRR